ncbi:MAG: hypothetical protein AAGH76_06155 [Pseudomonadota bacterium]
MVDSKRAGFEISSLYGFDLDASGCARTIYVYGSAPATGTVHVRWPFSQDTVWAEILDAKEEFEDFDIRNDINQFLGEPFEKNRVWLAKFDTEHTPLANMPIGKLSEALSITAWLFDESLDENNRPIENRSAYAEANFKEIRQHKGFDVGVLFVHGIGTQIRSSTLARFGTKPLELLNVLFAASSRAITGMYEEIAQLKWEEFAQKDKESDGRIWRRSDLRQRFKWTGRLQRIASGADHVADSGTDRVNLKDIEIPIAGRADIVDVSSRDDEPASATIQVRTLTGTNQYRESQWLLAENHWADRFAPPTASQTLRWSLMSIPIAMTFVAGRKAGETKNRWEVPPYMLVWSIIGVLLQAMVLVLALPALLPFQALAEFAQRLQSRLIAVVGDSLAFVDLKFDRAHLIGTFQKDLAWLRSRCQRVVVVAHSQGAAIAVNALKGYDNKSRNAVDVLATLGSGGRLLESFERDSDIFQKSSIAGWCGLLSVVVLAASWLVSSVASTVFLICIGLILLAIASAGAWRLHGKEDEYEIPDYSLPKWFDFHASHDPIALGPQARQRESFQENYSAVRVFNNGSFLSDHNAYFDNEPEFVQPLVQIIANQCGDGLLPLLPDWPAASVPITKSRKKMVSQLNVVRAIVVASTLALIGWFAEPLTLGIDRWLDASDPVASANARILLVRHSAIIASPLLTYLVLLFPLWRARARAVYRRDLAEYLKRAVDEKTSGP